MAAALDETVFPVAADFPAADYCGIEGVGAIKPYRATGVTSVPVKALFQDKTLSRNNCATVIMEGVGSRRATGLILIVNMTSPGQAAALGQPVSGRVLI